MQEQSHLRVSEPMFVGDVIGDPSLTSRLSPGASWLHLQLLATFLDRKNDYVMSSRDNRHERLNLESRKTFLGPSREVDMDRGAHAGAQVGGAGVEVPIPGWDEG